MLVRIAQIFRLCNDFCPITISKQVVKLTLKFYVAWHQKFKKT